MLKYSDIYVFIISLVIGMFLTFKMTNDFNNELKDIQYKVKEVQNQIDIIDKDILIITKEIEDIKSKKCVISMQEYISYYQPTSSDIYIHNSMKEDFSNLILDHIHNTFKK